MDDNTQAQLKELFDLLPKPIQKAITSVDIQQKLRAAANTHKLHLDQWEKLENEVMMALFGLKPIEKLEENIQNSLGVSAERAVELAGDVSEIVLAPIRQELERELEHPEAKVKEVSDIETARMQALGEAAPADSGGPLPPPPPAPVPTTTPPAAAPVQPATPPAPPPTEKAIRMPASGAYKPGEASAVRKDVHDDPYREPPA